MTRKNSSIMLLLVLTVLLLVVVSSRISPDPVGDNALSSSVADDVPLATEAPATDSPVDAPAASTAPGGEEQSDLPDVPIYDWNMKIVNNLSVLSSSFAPDVSAIADGQYFDSRAVEPLNAMIEAAKAQGFNVYISSAYRPYSTQAYIFFGKASQIAWDGTVEYADAEMMARELVAYPGTSEHQLGLAVDLIDSSGTALDAEKVEDMDLLVWLKENCADYGFILRYPKDKQEITGWYEPWHFRYVGEEAARYIMDKGLCLEEFVALY